MMSDPHDGYLGHLPDDASALDALARHDDPMTQRIRSLLQAMILDVEQDFSSDEGEAYIWTRELRQLLTDEGVAALEARYLDDDETAQ